MFVDTLTDQSCWALVAQDLLVDIIFVCRDARVLRLLWQVHLAQRWARGMGCDLGASPVKSRRGLRIIGLDTSPCIIEWLSFVSLWTLNTLLHMYLFELKFSCNNSFIQAMYVMYYTSILQCWQFIMILIKTNHLYLRVGRHLIWFIT
jgi:hypothetical protein